MDLLQAHQYRKRIQAKAGIEYLIEKTFLAFVITMPFLSAFSITAIVSIPFLLAMLLFGFMCLHLIACKKFPGQFIGLDIFFVFCFLLVVLVSYLVNGRGNGKSMNHTAAYISSILIFYVAVKFAFFCNQRSERIFRKTLQYLTVTVLVSAGYAIVEFVLNNFFNFNINDYIPRPAGAVKEYDASVLALFTRSRGFAIESGHFTFMMEMFAPLTIYFMFYSGFCHWSRFFKMVALVAIILSFLTAFSTATFILMPVAIFAASLTYLRSASLYVQKHFLKFFSSLLLIGLIVFVINFFIPIFDLIWLSIEQKLTDGGYGYRESNLNFFWTTFAHFDLSKQLIGAGPAGTVILGYGDSYAILNLFYSVTFELGFLGVTCLLSIIIYALLHVFKLPVILGYLCLIGLLTGTMHYYFIANYYYPWYWFLLVFIIFSANKSFKLK